MQLFWKKNCEELNKKREKSSSLEFVSHFVGVVVISWQGVLDKTLCDKVCQWLATGQWFSPVSSTNKTDRHDITEILLSLVKQYKPIKPNNKFVIPVAVDMFSGPASTQDQTLVLSENLILILFSLLF